MSGPSENSLDVAIVGGGISGLWLLNLLHTRGYRVALFEANRLGEGQTLASQGIIHGGLKYALDGKLTGAADAIAGMPDRWRQCLAGEDDVDLRGARLLSEHYYLYAGDSTLGRLTTFLASKALRGRVRKLPGERWPEALRGATSVYELSDFVVDTHSVLETLLRPVRHLAYEHRITATNLRRTPHGWQLAAGANQIDARCLLLTAADGAELLLQGLARREPELQRRPLHQVVARGGHLPPLYAHCLTGATTKPRLTITSHPDHRSKEGSKDGSSWLWCVGGQIAEDAVTLSEADLARHARRELAHCAPWIDWRDVGITSFRSDRVEASEPSGHRPDNAYAGLSDGLITCLPTKLSLAPDLGDRVLALLADAQLHPSGSGEQEPVTLPGARLGRPPWGAS